MFCGGNCDLLWNKRDGDVVERVMVRKRGVERKLERGGNPFMAEEERLVTFTRRAERGGSASPLTLFQGFTQYETERC
jgi:hypothetical protein